MDTMSPALPDFAKALAKRLLETQPEEVVARRRKHGHVLRNLPVEGVPAQEAGGTRPYVHGRLLSSSSPAPSSTAEVSTPDIQGKLQSSSGPAPSPQAPDVCMQDVQGELQSTSGPASPQPPDISMQDVQGEHQSSSDPASSPCAPDVSTLEGQGELRSSSGPAPPRTIIQAADVPEAQSGALGSTPGAWPDTQKEPSQPSQQLRQKGTEKPVVPLDSDKSPSILAGGLGGENDPTEPAESADLQEYQRWVVSLMNISPAVSQPEETEAFRS